MADNAAESRIRDLIEKGNLAQAYSEASSLNRGDTCDPVLQYLEVLALARMGAWAEARDVYRGYRLDRLDDADCIALEGRLRKEEAFASPVPDRPALLLQAAERYMAAYDCSTDYFPLTNAAMLSAAAGRADTALRLAAELLAHPEVVEGGDYWALITRAEGLMLTGAWDEALNAATEAVACDPGLGSRSATVQQFLRLLPSLGADEAFLADMLAIVRPPPVVHYCGHRQMDDPEDALREEIGQLLDRLGTRVAYGALASGADIVFAESLLDRSGELHIVLPFAKGDFVASSVAPAGEDWSRRFAACFEKAASVSFASEMPFVEDDHQFAYGSEFAMGLAKVRAAHLNCEVAQIALWDGRESTGIAGTASDIARWKRAGGQTHIIPVQRDPAPSAPSAMPASGRLQRAAHAILFADFQGFTKLAENLLPDFWGRTIAGLAKVVDRHGDAVLCRNSWGDAIYLVASTCEAATRIAIELQEELGTANSMDPSRAPLGLRIALHYGPMYRVEDPFTGQPNFIGTEVSRTARLEPITPPGSIYVTEPFAAILSLTAPDSFNLVHAGEIALAKDYGVQPVYFLNDRRLLDLPERQRRASGRG